MENTLKFEDFDLKRVKASPKEVTATYHTVEKTPEGDEHFDHIVTGDRIPHEDLLGALAKLKEPLVRSLCMIQPYEKAAGYLKGDQKKKVTEAWNKIWSTLEITAINWSGKDALEGVVITGKYTNELGGKSPLNSPRLVFTSDKLGYEKIVESQVEEVKLEVYEYLVKKKGAHADIFQQS